MADAKNISLSELQALIKNALNETFRGGVWVAAEIGEMKVNASSGHCYLELVEKGGANGIPKAKASAAIWRQTYGMLSAHFAAATGEELKPGMKILFKAVVTYHELYGLSLNITDIDPLYTMGDMERQRQEAIAKLKEEGVFDLNRELVLPLVPQRIAVISSPNAAGYQDFINELNAGGYNFSVTLFEAVMQGHGAEESIINALASVADSMEDFDTVVIIRGGGSQSDLSFLNSYLLNFHVAQFPLPVIAGLGHDKDQSILDMVAALSVKTPTAAAGFLVQRAAAVDAELDRLEEAAAVSAERMLAGHNARLQSLADTLGRSSAVLTRRVELRLERLQGEAARRSEAALLRRRGRLDLLEERLGERSSVALTSAGRRLDNAAALIQSRDPKNILALGFAIVRKDGRALRDAASVRPGERIEITLDKGGITAKTE